MPHSITAEQIKQENPVAIILSGGPKSVHVDGAPTIDPAIYDLGIPILGICYGAQLIAQQLGGTVARSGRGEYGKAKVITHGSSVLLPDGVADGDHGASERFHDLCVDSRRTSSFNGKF